MLDNAMGLVKIFSATSAPALAGLSGRKERPIRFDTPPYLRTGVLIASDEEEDIVVGNSHSEGFGRGDVAPARGPSDSRRGPGVPWWKAIVVLIVLAAIAVTLILKSSRKGRSGEQSSGVKVAGPGPEEVIATVNGEEITLGRLEAEFQGLPEQIRSEYGSQKQEFLEDLIARRLLLQEANKLKIAETAAYKEALAEHTAHPGHEEEALLGTLLQTQVLEKVRVTEEELRDFFGQREAAAPSGQAFEVVREALRNLLLQQKQNEAAEKYISDVKGKAEITRNDEWIRAERALTADNPLDRALSSGRPVVADFGRGECIPCKMMKPILEELARDYKGRAEVLIIDIDEYPALKRRVGVQFIPLQVFYDASGKEVDRHEGFMPKDDIREQLAKLGVK